MPQVRKYDDEVIGYKDHISMASNKLIEGAMRNGDMFASLGLDCSFRKSFSASARGCGKPIIPTLLGPFRV